MEKIFIILMVCYMGIFRIPSVPQVHSNKISNENAISEFESLPFQVVMDKTSLETGKSEKVTCCVVSAVDDFSYSVFAETVKLATNIHHLLIILGQGKDLQTQLTLSVQIKRQDGNTLSLLRCFFQIIHQ